MMTMTGRLDDISEAIGGLRVGLKLLNESRTTDRILAEERHKENTKRLTTIEVTLTGLASDRRLVVIVISGIVGGIIWLLSYIAPFLFKKWQ